MKGFSSNRVGKNVFRDRRKEFRIGITKNLLENLGPYFADASVKQVNCVCGCQRRFIHQIKTFSWGQHLIRHWDGINLFNKH